MKLDTMPTNGVTISMIQNELGIERETVRAALKRNNVKPLGWVKVKSAKTNVFNLTDVDFIYSLGLKRSTKETLNTDIRAFLAIPAPSDVSWNYYR